MGNVAKDVEKMDLDQQLGSVEPFPVNGDKVAKIDPFTDGDINYRTLEWW